MEYKSQIGQDKYIVENIFGRKKNGYFIELGACDGELFSNTYYLEKHLDWKGICIEPNPNFTEKLKQNRNCNLSFSPVFSESGKKVIFTVDNEGELSGISNYITHNKTNFTEIELETKTLTQILDECSAPSYIDYMSLDTEGSELEVLKGLDFNKYTIGYICVEHNFRPLRYKIMQFLFEKGYKHARWNRFDDEYMHDTLGIKFCWSDCTTEL